MKKQIFKGLCAATVLGLTITSSTKVQAQSAPVQEPEFGHDIEYQDSFLYQLWGIPTLRGTKCWVSTDRTIGKPIFTMLHFFNPRHGHSLVSGQIVQASGDKPDFVEQVSGSAGYHEYQDEDGNTVRRFLMDLNTSYTRELPSGGDPLSRLVVGVRGHLGIRVDADDLSADVVGVDTFSKWTSPLTGPSVIYDADKTVTGSNGVTANYMGGVDCRDGECGTILPLNRRESWRIVGRNFRQCKRALRNLPLD